MIDHFKKKYDVLWKKVYGGMPYVNENVINDFQKNCLDLLKDIHNRKIQRG